MNRPHPQRMWETFLRIGESARFNSEKDASLSPEEQGKVAREAALTALKRVKMDVLPFVQKMQEAGFIDWFSFLIHDRESGVPIEDNGAYIHLRVALRENGIFTPLRWTEADWKCIRRMECAEHDVEDWCLLGEQSALVLAVIERHADLDGIPLLEKLGQHFHYCANMVQLPFPRPEWMTP